MPSTPHFPFPDTDDVAHITTAVADIALAPAEQPLRWHPDAWREAHWSAEVWRGSSDRFDKAGAALVRLHDGMVDETPTSITLLQTVLWPRQPQVPAFIFMASTSRMEEQEPISMLYTDLIRQHDEIPVATHTAFTSALAQACSRHGESIDDLQMYLQGRDMLGGCAAGCGVLYFFPQDRIEIMRALLGSALTAYRDTLARTPSPSAATTTYRHRQRIATWMETEDYGFKVGRQNGIPAHIMQAYAFPPTPSENDI